MYHDYDALVYKAINKTNPASMFEQELRIDWEMYKISNNDSCGYDMAVSTHFHLLKVGPRNWHIYSSQMKTIKSEDEEKCVEQKFVRCRNGALLYNYDPHL